MAPVFFCGRAVGVGVFYEKISFIRFKPNPEHYDEFTLTLQDFLDQRIRGGVEHIYHMTKRKSKYTLEQAADSLMKMDISDVVEVVLKKGKNTLGLGPDKKTALPAPSSSYDSQALRRFGWAKGRAIKSEQTLLAITHWCHVFVSKRQLAKLDLQDIAVLTSAFKDGLRSVVEK